MKLTAGWIVDNQPSDTVAAAGPGFPARLIHSRPQPGM